MTLLFMDSWDTLATATSHPPERGWVVVGGVDIVAGIGRFGTQGFRFLTNGHSLSRINISHTDPTIFFGVAVKPSTFGGGVDGIFYLYGDAGATNHITCNAEADGSISVRRGTHSGTELGRTADLGWSTTTHHYIEVKVLISDTVGTVDIYKNGINVLSLTSQDTKNGGTNSYIDKVTMQGAASFFWSGDDFYLGNTIGSDMTDVVGDVHVEAVFPDTEGATIQFTPSTGTDNSDTIDENPAHNNTDYNSNSTPGNIDRFNMVHLADATVTIHGIQLGSWAQKSDSGTIQFRHNILSDASVATGQDHSPGTGFGWFLDLFENDPDGGGAWTGAQLDAAEIGYETRA